MRATGFVSLAAATALCVAACSGADTAAVVHLGPDDNGRTVTLAVGDRLQVILSGGRLSGDWAAASDPGRHHRHAGPSWSSSADREPRHAVDRWRMVALGRRQPARRPVASYR